MTAIDPVFSIVVNSAMATLFAVAAAHKFQAQSTFRAALTDYQVLPSALTLPIALIIPVIELSAAVMILFPASKQYAAAMMIILLILYTAAIGLNIYRGRSDLDCGCTGPASKQTLSGWLVIRNLLLIGLLFITLSPSIARALNWMDILVIAFSVLTATSLYAGLNRLFAQSRQLNELRQST
jgi:hypothetical protein